MKRFPIHNHINGNSEFFQILKFLPRVDENGPWVAGGSVWKAIENRPMDCDIDFFFATQHQVETFIRTMKMIPYDYRVISEKTNSYNVSFDYHINDKGYNKTVKIQCIYFKVFPTIHDLLDGFDFTACQFAFDGQHLHTGDTSFDDLANRDIVYHNVRDCYATTRHVKKYTEKGFKISSAQEARFNEILKAENDALNKPKPIVDGVFSSGGFRQQIDGIIASGNNVGRSTFGQPTPITLGGLQQADSEDDGYPRPVEQVTITIPPTPAAVYTTEPSDPISIPENVRNQIEQEIRRQVDQETRNVLTNSAAVVSPGVSVREVDTSGLPPFPVPSAQVMYADISYANTSNGVGSGG